MKANIELIPNGVDDDGLETYETKVLGIEIEGNLYAPEQILEPFNVTRLGRISPSLVVATLLYQIELLKARIVALEEEK